MSVIVEPPHWSLQPFERTLLLREVVALSGASASWDGDRVVIEQQAYLRAGERIDAIDLLCSGFQPEGE